MIKITDDRISRTACIRCKREFTQTFQENVTDHCLRCLLCEKVQVGIDEHLSMWDVLRPLSQQHTEHFDRYKFPVSLVFAQLAPIFPSMILSRHFGPFIQRGQSFGNICYPLCTSPCLRAMWMDWFDILTLQNRYVCTELRQTISSCVGYWNEEGRGDVLDISQYKKKKIKDDRERERERREGGERALTGHGTQVLKLDVVSVCQTRTFFFSGCKKKFEDSGNQRVKKCTWYGGSWEMGGNIRIAQVRLKRCGQLSLQWGRGAGKRQLDRAGGI